jgi:hypothetical protein
MSLYRLTVEHANDNANANVTRQQASLHIAHLSGRQQRKNGLSLESGASSDLISNRLGIIIWKMCEVKITHQSVEICSMRPMPLYCGAVEVVGYHIFRRPT